MRQHVKEIPLNDFPSLKTNRQSGILRQIEKTLRLFCKKNKIKNKALLIPSLATLANHFRASQLNTLNALLLLRKHDYYFEINGFNKPIKLWVNQ